MCICVSLCARLQSNVFGLKCEDSCAIVRVSIEAGEVRMRGSVYVCVCVYVRVCLRARVRMRVNGLKH